MASSATILSCFPTFLGKPPPHSSKTRRLQTVSCNYSEKIDRRNLLMGMGGMYGATNLVSSPALAAPISPDLETCERGVDLNKNNEKLDVDCCKKESNQPTPYKLKPVDTVRIRPAAHLVTPEYQEKYERAVKLMMGLPVDDPRNFYQQANVHCAYCNLSYDLSGVDPKTKLQIHFSWNFFPWHRWYLYFYERILGNLINDPTFGLPFWNWDNLPPGAPYIASMYVNDVNSSLYNPRRDPEHLRALADLKYAGTDTPEDKRVNSNQAEMYSEMITNAATLVDFYGGNLYADAGGDPATQNISGSIERGSHTALHRWVGQNFTPENDGVDMGNFYTAGKEPIFFAHHANIDRLWSVRRDQRASSQLPKEFDDSDWLNSSYVFYDENKELVRVYVKDCLDHAKMGYTFDKVDNPWENFKPAASTKGLTVRRKRSTPEKVDFPVKLDKVVKLLVKRPAGGKRSKEAKKREEEMLVIEGIEVDTSKPVRFEVYVNDTDDKPNELIDKAEYAGCFGQVPHKSGPMMKSQIRLGLSKLLEILDIEDEDQILVSLVPRAGGQDTTIGGLKIVYVDYATGKVHFNK